MPAKNYILILFGFLLLACEDGQEVEYETFLIPAGKHSGSTPVAALQSDKLEFKAIFNTTAIYTASTEENQWDTHKLLGFADCNSHHHQHSARFGWRWVEERLEIIAYCYVSGERIIEKIGEIELYAENHFILLLKNDAYVFQLNNEPPVTIEREKPCNIGAYYMLWPYFGGQETAPHDISIDIKILY